MNERARDIQQRLDALMRSPLSPLIPHELRVLLRDVAQLLVEITRALERTADGNRTAP